MPTVIPSQRTTGFLALTLIIAGVSGCDPLSYSGPELSGSIQGQTGARYDLWVSTPRTENGDETTSAASFNFNPPLVYYVTLGGQRYRCNSDCRDEIRVYESGGTPGASSFGREESDDGDSSGTSPGL